MLLYDIQVCNPSQLGLALSVAFVFPPLPSPSLAPRRCMSIMLLHPGADTQHNRYAAAAVQLHRTDCIPLKRHKTGCILLRRHKTDCILLRRLYSMTTEVMCIASMLNPTLQTICTRGNAKCCKAKCCKGQRDAGQSQVLAMVSAVFQAAWS